MADRRQCLKQRFGTMTLQPCWNGHCLWWNKFQACWNWHVGPWHITAMLTDVFTKTHSRHAETHMFDHDTLQHCWNGCVWPRHITDMLRRVFKHDTLDLCWNGHCWRRHITVMLKLKCLTTTHYRYAETDLFDRDTLQPCWNRHCWQWHIPVMLKLTCFTRTHYRNAETYVFDRYTLQTSWNLLFFVDDDTFFPCCTVADFFYHDTLHPWWNWHCWRRNITAML